MGKGAPALQLGEATQLGAASKQTAQGPCVQVTERFINPVSQAELFKPPEQSGFGLLNTQAVSCQRYRIAQVHSLSEAEQQNPDPLQQAPDLLSDPAGQACCSESVGPTAQPQPITSLWA